MRSQNSDSSQKIDLGHSFTNVFSFVLKNYIEKTGFWQCSLVPHHARVTHIFQMLLLLIQTKQKDGSWHKHTCSSTKDNDVIT
jgi:hypothetical protein